MKRIAIFLMAFSSFVFAEESFETTTDDTMIAESQTVVKNTKATENPTTTDDAIIAESQTVVKNTKATENPTKADNAPVAATQSAGQKMQPTNDANQMTMSSPGYRRYNFTIKAEFSYFQPSDETFLDIYGGGIDYGFDISTSIWRSLDVFFGFDYFQKEGHSLGGHNRTEIQLIPLSAGLRYRFMMNRYSDFYIGLGPAYTHLHIHDYSPYVKEITNKWDWGGVGQVGFNFYPVKYLILSIFCDYFYTEMHFSGNHCNVEQHNAFVGGFNAGGAIGLTF